MAPPINRRTGFSRRAQYGLFLSYVVAGVGMVIGVLLLLLSRLDPPAFSTLRVAVAEVTTPISSVFAGARGAVSIPQSVFDNFGGANKIRALRTELEQQRAIILRARTLNAENRRLRALLRLRDMEAQPITTARLVSSTGTSTRRFAVLNAGRWQGVRPGQPVRAPDGLVGRILEAGPNSARVLLILDAESIVPVRRTRDGLPAIVTGRGDGLLDVRSASVADVAFRAGDAFVTSGRGGLYPPNVPVARALKNGRDNVLAAPFADPDAMDFALVQQPFSPPPPPPLPTPVAK